MSFSGSFAVVGAYEHPTRWAPDKTELQIIGESARGALEDAGLSLADVDGLFSASMSLGGMGIVSVAEYLNLKPRYIDGSNIGGSSFVSHVTHAGAAIAAGLCDIALIVYGSVAASDASAIGTGMRGGRDAGSAFVAPYGQTLVGSYAMAARRHMHEFGTKPEQLAEIAVSTRGHAALNPKAKMRLPITVEGVMESRMIADPLHLLDCCIISDGGGAVVVTSLERARDLAKRPVLVQGCGEAVCHQEVGSPDLMTIAAKQSGENAFRMAGVSQDDIDLCTIYDSFTITVLMTLEDLGFCKKGEGGAFIDERSLRYDGDFPCNTHGGQLGCGQAGLAGGLSHVTESVLQLQRRGEARQVRDADVAYVNGTGGMMAEQVALILEGA